MAGFSGVGEGSERCGVLGGWGLGERGTSPGPADAEGLEALDLLVGWEPPWESWEGGLAGVKGTWSESPSASLSTNWTHSN